MPKISELPAMTLATSADLIPIVDDSGNITKKVEAQNILPAGSVGTTDLANSAVTLAKVERSTFEASTTLFGSNLSSAAAPQTAVTGSYSFVNGNKYLIMFSASLIGTTVNADVLNVALRVNGVTVSNGRWQSANTFQQTAMTIPHIYTAAATASYTVDAVITRLSGSGNINGETLRISIVPLVN